MKKSSDNIHLVNRHVALCGQRKEDTGSLRLVNRSIGFIIVLSVDLSVALRNDSGFVQHVTISSWFSAEYTTKAMSLVAKEKGSKREHPVLVERLRFTDDSIYPFLSVRSPGRWRASAIEFGG